MPKIKTAEQVEAQREADQPLSVRCPYCLQEPWHACVKFPGLPTRVHRSRYNYWLSITG